jgi:hypothetical protein
MQPQGKILVQQGETGNKLIQELVHSRGTWKSRPPGMVASHNKIISEKRGNNMVLHGPLVDQLLYIITREILNKQESLINCL